MSTTSRNHPRKHRQRTAPRGGEIHPEHLVPRLLLHSRQRFIADDPRRAHQKFAGIRSEKGIHSLTIHQIQIPAPKRHDMPSPLLENFSNRCSQSACPTGDNESFQQPDPLREQAVNKASKTCDKPGVSISEIRITAAYGLHSMMVHQLVIPVERLWHHCGTVRFPSYPHDYDEDLIGSKNSIIIKRGHATSF